MRTVNRFKNGVFIFSALSSIVAGIYILLQPLTVTEQIATQINDSAGATTEITRLVSWYSLQGIWGVTILLIFALLFSFTAWLAVTAHDNALALSSLAALLLTYLSGFSIGAYYLPAALGVFFGWVLLLYEKWSERKAGL